MEFPHRHHHGHRRDDDDDDRRGPPPPAYGRSDAADPAYGYGQAPPPHYGRDDADPYARPPPPSSAYGGGDAYDRHPPPTAYGRDDDGYGGRVPAPAYGAGGYGNVVHVSHEVGDERPHYGGGGLGGGYGGGGPGYGDETRPHQGGSGGYGGGGSEYGHETRPHHGGGGGAALPVRQQMFRIFCKAGEEQYSLAARDGKVCLVRTDRDDDAQNWIKDMKYSTRVKDEEGYPAIVLVNKATGEALKHSLGQSHPVRLASYDPEYLDESVLWTESRDVGDGFRCIRMVNNIYLNFDALHGDKDHGGVRDGTTLVLWEWCEGDNQRWKIVPW
ncbi:ricin B-like lectin R40G3 [Phragmites australis]|uniref:ricin B-like lectin R40G3 n=1 Tax=Phragmites australis TaxID=29695 RepID=UPI002D78D530|nr:ricin B-like lectin R40G3 [Phragmites australis]